MTNQLPVPRDLDGLERLASVFVASGWSGGDCAQAMVKILWGREMGLGPVASVQGIDVIQGRPSPSAGLVAAQIDAHDRYAYAEVIRNTKLCRLAFFVGAGMAYASPYASDRWDRWLDKYGTDAPNPPPGYGLAAGVHLRGVEEFSIEDATTAGLAGGKNWKSYPRQMLFARAITEGQRSYAPNLWGGLKNYVPDELGSQQVPAEVIEAEVVPTLVPTLSLFAGADEPPTGAGSDLDVKTLLADLRSASERALVVAREHCAGNADARRVFSACATVEDFELFEALASKGNWPPEPEAPVEAAVAAVEEPAPKKRRRRKVSGPKP